jgi:hypothetical protein
MVHKQVVYHWVAGSMPPPFHDEIDIVLDGHTGHLDYWDGYRAPDSVPHRFVFKADPARVAELDVLLEDISSHSWQVQDPPRVGGSQEWLEYGPNVSIPPNLVDFDERVADDIYQRVRELAPAGVWEEIRKAREKMGE